MVFKNGTEWLNTTTCPDGKPPCTWAVSMTFPKLGLCAFRYYRIRMFPKGTDASMIASITEFLLWYKTEVFLGAVAKIETTSKVDAEEETYSLAMNAVDGRNTSWIDLDMNNLYVYFRYDVLADEACVTLGRKPDVGIDWALDASHNM